MPYPDRCIRGISNLDCVKGEVVYLTLFDFHNSANKDGIVEESINWMDDEYAEEFTFNQTRKNGVPEFKVGIAILLRSNLDIIKKHLFFRGYFDYERKSIQADPDQGIQANPYHGNLLLKDSIGNRLKHMLRVQLALYAKVVYRTPRK